VIWFEKFKGFHVSRVSRVSKAISYLSLDSCLNLLPLYSVFLRYSIKCLIPEEIIEVSFTIELHSSSFIYSKSYALYI